MTHYDTLYSNGKRSVCEMIVKKLFFNMLSIGYIDTNNTFWSYFTVKQGGFGSLARKKDDWPLFYQKYPYPQSEFLDFLVFFDKLCESELKHLS